MGMIGKRLRFVLYGMHENLTHILQERREYQATHLHKNYLAIFCKRYVIDVEYGGLTFEKEGEGCAEMLNDPKIKIMIMGNHGGSNHFKMIFWTKNHDQ